MVTRQSVQAWLPAELTSDQVQALHEDLEPLNLAVPKPGRLAARAVAFALEGNDDGILDRLAAVAPYVGGYLDVKKTPPPGRQRYRSGIRRVFRSGGPFPAPFLIRLGLVYQASALGSEAPEKPTHPEVPPWLEILLWEAGDAHPNVSPDPHHTCAVSCGELEAALQGAGLDPSLLVLAILHAPLYQDGFRRVALAMPGLRESLAAHPQAVARALRERDALGKTHALHVLRASGVDPTPWAETIVELACCSAGSVRSNAVPLVVGAPAACLDAAREHLVSGKAQARANAAELVWQLGGEGERALLSEQETRDRSKRVRATIQRLLASAPPSRVHTFPLLFPPRPGAETRGVFNRTFAGAPPSTRDDAWEVITRPERLSTPPPPDLAAHDPDDSRPARATRQREVATQPDVFPIHIVRLACSLGLFQGWGTDDYQRFNFQTLDQLLRENREVSGDPCSLPEVAAAFSASGLDPRTLGRVALYPKTSSREFSAAQWEGVGAYYAAYPDVVRDLLRDGLASAVGSWRGSIHRELDLILEALDPIPEALVPTLVEVGLGSSKKDCKLVRPHLGRVSGLVGHLLPALEDRKQGIRMAAAEWLADLGAEEAISPLERALTREKRDKPRRALAEALARLRG